MTREEAIEYLVPINKEFRKLGFNRQLTAAIDVLTSNPWYKTSEELPKEPGSYLVKYTIDSCPVLYDGICNYNECRWIKSPLLGKVRITITYWMKIPEIKKD